MKIRRLFIGATMTLLSMIPLVVLAQGKYVAKPNEEVYGTWINEKTINSFHMQKTVSTPNAWKDFTEVKDIVPHDEGTTRIDEKWTDSEGNVWYKTFNTITKGTWKGYKNQALQKISQSGTVMEMVFISVGEFDPKLYPTTVDPKDDNYRIFYRADE